MFGNGKQITLKKGKGLLGIVTVPTQNQISTSNKIKYNAPLKVFFSLREQFVIETAGYYFVHRVIDKL